MLCNSPEERSSQQNCSQSQFVHYVYFNEIEVEENKKNLSENILQNTWLTVGGLQQICFCLLCLYLV
jgi:hypothetical protein